MRLIGSSSGSPDVRASFEMSYEQLSRPQRALFRRLRLLPEPSFGPGAAGALADADARDAREILDRLPARHPPSAGRGPPRVQHPPMRVAHREALSRGG